MSDYAANTQSTPPQADEVLDLDVSKWSEEWQQKVIKQVQAEYELAWNHLQPKLENWYNRLKLYNNQKRDPSAVGDTTLFTVFQTLLASLYEDKLTTKFDGHEEGDDETAENLNHMAETDVIEMEKDIHDYDWDWNTLFFGRALSSFTYFDRETKTPIPECWDMTCTLRDPDATSVHGNRAGIGAARFLGRILQRTKVDLSKKEGFFNIEAIKDGEDKNSLFVKAREARSEAQNRQEQTDRQVSNKDLGDNQAFETTQWYTSVDGKKYCLELANTRSLIVKVVEIKTKNKSKRACFPITDRTFYPIPNDWDGVSVPDLVEDKQRHKAIILNLWLDLLRSQLYPMYLYDTNRIKNKADLDFEFNKFIGIDGQTAGAVEQMQKVGEPFGVEQMMEIIDTGAQKSTATPDIRQGIQSEKNRPLGETNLLMQGVDTRSSMSAKIFGWSEKRFWMMYYWMMKAYFKEGIDEKSIRIVGAYGPKWRVLTKANFISHRSDPDVSVESTMVSEAKRMRRFQELMQAAQLLLADPSVDRRYFYQQMLKLIVEKKDEIERFQPLTIDEMRAEEENTALSKNKLVMVQANDNHQQHLGMHKKAADTPATYAHVKGHEEAMMMQRNNPELFPELKQQKDEQMALAMNAGGGGRKPLPTNPAGV